MLDVQLTHIAIFETKNLALRLIYKFRISVIIYTGLCIFGGTGLFSKILKNTCKYYVRYFNATTFYQL